MNTIDEPTIPIQGAGAGQTPSPSSPAAEGSLPKKGEKRINHPPRSFNLTRWFSVLSFASIMAVSFLSSTFLSRFISDEMLQRDAAVTREVLQSVYEVENAQAFFLNPTASSDDKRIKDFFVHIGNLPDVLRANVYSRDRTLLWSTETRLVGQKFDHNEDLEEALAGKIAVDTGITGREEHPKQEHKFLDNTPVRFVESYLPLKDPASGAVIGVVELYRIPRTVFETIKAGTRLIWTFAILGGLFLFFGLFWIVFRADRTIRSQQDRLVESETMAALGEMASAVAHGIRNPLASIRSSAELALCEKGTTCSGCSLDIINEVDRIERWVRDLLTYSNPEGGDIGKVSLPEALQRSLESFARDAERRGITVNIDLPPSLPRVQADEALLGQVINSLVINAMEAMPQGGQLTLAGEVEPRARQVKIGVRDTGVGIPADKLDKVFLPFYTTKPQGMGVGLSLARRILRRFGGDITIRSQQGHGTTVTLHLLMAR